MRFVHISDLHLGKTFPVARYGQLAARRRQELLDTFSRLIDYVNENQVDFILCSGDFLNSEELRVEELMACRRQAVPDGEEDPVKNLLTISDDSLKRERRRSWSRLGAVLVLLLAAGLMIVWNALIQREQSFSRIYLKETVGGVNYLYIDALDGHLLRLQCGDGIDFDSLQTGYDGYQMEYVWNRATHHGVVSACTATGYVCYQGSIFTGSIDYSSYANFLFGYTTLKCRGENLYQDPYLEPKGRVFVCDLRFFAEDPETGEDLPDEVDGEFCAKGYNIMKGYYKMPEATAAAIDKDGWLHTGDLARRTPEGNFKITGRIKDMIIRGGENIYPKEIEDFIYTHPKVRDVQVIGVPDEQYGEEIMAVVILKEGETSSEEEIKDYVRTHMAKHKVPRYVSFVKEFPMNAAGKILKYKMREDAVELLKLQKANSIVTA